MNLNHTVKVVGSVILSAVMAGNMMPIYATETTSDDTNPTEKTETVYAVLNDDGSVSNTIVSSWLHDEDGISNIKETLNLKNVKNIKTNEEPSKSGNTYTWNAKGNDVYYQGDATATLPVTLKIKYELDGKEVSSSNIEGKSGHLKMTLSFTNNQSETKTINGKNIVIHPSYLAGGIINMSTGNFTNVKCEQGKIVNDGSNEILAFASIPGLNETLESAGLSKVNDELGISDDVTVEADVEDFDLGSIMVGMTNEIDLDKELDSIADVSELTDGIDELVSADDQLIDGAKQLYDGTTTLKEEATPLTSASGQVRTLSSGAIQLNDGVKALQTGLKSYTSGVSLVDAGVSQLYGIPQGAATIKAAMTVSTKEQTSLVDGAQALEDGLGQLLGELNSTNVTTTVSQMNQLLNYSKTQLNTMQTGLTYSKSKLKAMQSDLNEASKQLDGLSQLQRQLETLGKSIAEKEQQNNNAIQDYNSKKNTVNSEITKIKENLKTAINSSITALTDAKDHASSQEDKDAIDAQIDLLKNQLSAIDSISTIEGLNELQSLTDEFTQLNEALSTLNSTVSSMNTMVTNALATINGDGTETNPGLSNVVTSALGTIDKLKETLSGSTEQIGTMQKMLEQLKPGVTKLYNGAMQLNSGASKLATAVGQLQNQSQSGIDQVKAGTSQLTSNNDSLNSGAETLSEATGTLASQSDTFNEMADGLDTLSEAFTTLNDGAKQLYEGQQQFKDEGLSQLQEKVNLGVEELETLQSVLDEIESMNKKYASYSGAPEGATVTSRYVFRTKDSSED